MWSFPCLILGGTSLAPLAGILGGGAGDVPVGGGPASLSAEPDNRPGNFFPDGGRARLAVTLPTATTLDLALTVDAGTLRADLGGAGLSSPSASPNAADGRIDRSAAG